MGRISPEDLKSIKERVEEENTLTPDGYTVHIIVHLGTCGIAAGGREVLDALKEEVEKSGRADIRIVVSGCMGMCSSEPNMTIRRMNEDAVVYRHLDADKTREVFEGHVMNGEMQKKYALARMK